jgi:hypothetical protein
MAQAGEERTDQPTGGQRPLSLTIPCRPEYVALCRLVVGALGAHEALDEESIADFKVVVTEACNCFLGDPEGCASPYAGEGQGETAGEGELLSSLRVDFFVLPGAWEIVVSDPDQRHRISPSSLCDPMSGGGLGLTIIRALVDSMEQTDSDAEGSVIRLVKRIPSRLAVPD